MPRCLLCGKYTQLNENGVCKYCQNIAEIEDPDSNNGSNAIIDLDFNKKYVVKQSLFKTIFFLTAGIIMDAASLFSLSIGNRELYGPVENSIPIDVIGVAIFSLGCIVLIKRLIIPKNILEISKDGFIDNSTLKSIGFVSWNVVKYIYLSNVASQTYIAISVNNIYKFLDDLSLKKRRNVEANLSIGCSPIMITLFYTKANNEAVLNIMKAYLDHYNAENSEIIQSTEV
jgi:hypothetical protein